VFKIQHLTDETSDLNNSYILNNDWRNSTSGLARVGGKIWSLVEPGLIISKHVRLFAADNRIDGPRSEFCKEL
jgi:hypothetical protein